MKKRIIILAITAILTIITCIPIFAISYDVYTRPTDIDQIVDDVNSSNPVYRYTVIQVKQLPDTNRTYNVLVVNAARNLKLILNTNGIVQIEQVNENFVYEILSTSNENQDIAGYYKINCTINNNYYITEFFKPITYGRFIGIEDEYISVHTYSIVSQETQDYNNGYNAGYNAGYEAGTTIEQYTNIKGYVEQLLRQFVGEDAAPYIAPIAIVLVILFVYFLFIRFLLSLIKAKGVLKICDITMLVACICILIVMYVPMFSININNTNTTTESAQQVIIEREQVIVSEYKKITTETGDMWVLKDVTLPPTEIETTTSDEIVTDVEVSSQLEKKEVTEYEEKN